MKPHTTDAPGDSEEIVTQEAEQAPLLPWEPPTVTVKPITVSTLGAYNGAGSDGTFFS